MPIRTRQRVAPWPLAQGQRRVCSDHRSVNLPDCTLLLTFALILLEGRNVCRERTLITQRLFANHATAARQFSPVNPPALHPVVDCSPCHPRYGNGEMNGQEPCLSLAMVTEELRGKQAAGSSQELVLSNRLRPFRAICTTISCDSTKEPNLGTRYNLSGLCQ